MKKTITLSFFIISQLIIYGQAEFAPPGARWCYDFFGSHLSLRDKIDVYYDRDTLIKGKLCKIIKSDNWPDNNVGLFYGEMPVYQKEDSIFYYRAYNKTFNFLFRNNLQKGDTLDFPRMANYDINVVNIDSLMIDGVLVEAYELMPDYNPFDANYIYDRAGPNQGFFDKWGAASWDGFSYYLNWYSDDEIAEWKILEKPCGSLFTSTNEETKEPVKIYPNPVSIELNVHYSKHLNKKIYFQIFDLSGKLIVGNNSLGVDQKITVDFLNPGFYILLLETPEGFFPLKFIKLQ